MAVSIFSGSPTIAVSTTGVSSGADVAAGIFSKAVSSVVSNTGGSGDSARVEIFDWRDGRSFELGRCYEFNRRIDRLFSGSPTIAVSTTGVSSVMDVAAGISSKACFVCGFQYRRLRKIRRRVEIFDWRDGRSFELGRCYEFNRRIDRLLSGSPTIAVSTTGVSSVMDVAVGISSKAVSSVVCSTGGFRKIRRRVGIFDWRNGRSFELRSVL